MTTLEQSSKIVAYAATGQTGAQQLVPKLVSYVATGQTGTEQLISKLVAYAVIGIISKANNQAYIQGNDF